MNVDQVKRESNGETKMMHQDTSEDTMLYQVVVNHEEQYSIWLDHRDIPPGWQAVGKTGCKQDCLDYIKAVWTDMRPLSLRQRMEDTAYHE
jgi:MbtH protein